MSLQAAAIPNTTKSITDWGICVWNEWDTSRLMTIAGVHEIVPLTRPLLEMPLVDLTSMVCILSTL